MQDDKIKQHEAYKNLVKKMLFDFFCDSQKEFYFRDPKHVSLKEVRDFVSIWFDSHCKDPVGEWLES